MTTAAEISQKFAKFYEDNDEVDDDNHSDSITTYKSI